MLLVIILQHIPPTVKSLHSYHFYSWERQKWRHLERELTNSVSVMARIRIQFLDEVSDYNLDFVSFRKKKRHF